LNWRVPPFQVGTVYRPISDLPDALEFSAVRVHPVALRSLALCILPLLGDWRSV
jgi:hypothetical protein